MIKARWLAIFYFAACAAAALGASGDIEISGTILDSGNGKPIQHAIVHATRWKSDDPPHPEVLVILTSEDGRFRFIGLPAGRYDIRVQKPGYYADDYRHDIVASTSLVLHLTENAVIRGTVKDSGGFPIAGAQVAVESGTWKGHYEVSAVTDMDGAFRVCRSPGAYRVGVLSPGSMTLLRAQGLSFSPIYYPNTGDADAAAAFNLAPGQEFVVDLRVKPIPAREIRGLLETGFLTAVSVLPAGSDNFRVAWGISRHEEGSREFRVSGLVPGIYALDFQVDLPSGSTILRKTVQVKDADVTDVLVSSADRAPGR